MCSNECPCESGVSNTYPANSIDWTPYGGTARPIFSGPNPVTSYKACLANAPASNSADPATTYEFRKFAESFRGQSDYQQLMEWIEFFENEYDCAGICKVALFYFNRNPASSRPSQSCINSLKDEITSAFLGLGIATMICGFMLFFIFIMQYCLWRKY